MFALFRLFASLLAFILIEIRASSFLIVIITFFVLTLVRSSDLCSCSSLSSGLVFIIAVIALLFFSTESLFVLFVCYESSLIPVSLLILVFGYQPEKANASFFLFIYMVVFSYPLLYYVVLHPGSISSSFSIAGSLSGLVISLSFMAKSPLFTLHAWLPKAHVEAPLVGSVLLSGIMLKFGGYGILLLSSNLIWWSWLLVYLSLSGAVVCSLLCFRASDIKSIVAYSSVVHIGTTTLGALSGLELGVFVALGILITHSLLSPLLFILAFELYSSNSSRRYIHAHSSSLSSPILFLISLLCGLSFGLPPSLGFWVEVSLFRCLGVVFSTSLLLLGITSFLVFLYCIRFYVSSVAGSFDSSIATLRLFYLYIPGTFLCLLMPLSSSVFTFN